MQNLQASWQGAPVSGKLASATDTQKHTACLLHKGVYTQEQVLTISLLSTVSDITQSIRAVRVKPHQARQQRLGGPHTRACQSTWTLQRLLNAARL